MDHSNCIWVAAVGSRAYISGVCRRRSEGLAGWTDWAGVTCTGRVALVVLIVVQEWVSSWEA